MDAIASNIKVAEMLHVYRNKSSVKLTNCECPDT
jgi:hypothetical protein